MIRNSKEESSLFVSRCDREGNWKPVLPDSGCERKICPSPPSITNGFVVDDPLSTFKFEDTASYSCNSGYFEKSNLLLITCKVGASSVK